MKTPSKINKITDDKEGEINGGDSYMSESNVVEDLPLAKINDDLHLVKSNKSQDGEQSKKKIKKKKQSDERKHKEYKEFKSNDCEDDNQGKKMKKKQKLTEGNTPKECNDFRSNGEEDGRKEKKVKKMKKKQSEESKRKEHNEFKSNECEEDQGKKMKKKRKLIEGNTLNECDDFRSNGEEDGQQEKKVKKKKKKKQSEESKHKEYNEFKSNECEDDQGKKMKKKKKLTEGNTLNECNDFRSNGCEHDEQQEKTKKKKKKSSEESKHKKKRKRVTFSDEVETFCCDGLVRGKRYTPEEDEMIKASVFDYIDSHGLGDEGLDKVLHCSSYPEVRGCWKEIAKVLPHRPLESVYSRAHNMLENVGGRKWSPDDAEFVRKSYEQHGPNWKLIAEALGKNSNQVKELWRRTRNDKLKSGFWSQEEYQTLFDLVNLDLQARALEPYKKSQHGMLRDNISWEAISEKLGTRIAPHCCNKWYLNLTSPMVASGDWCDTDDYRMMKALYTLDACCMEEVDWDELLEHRSGDVCRKRWEQMVRWLGEHASKPFIEQVEILTKRFCPELLEARETFDSLPVTC